MRTTFRKMILLGAAGLHFLSQPVWAQTTFYYISSIAYDATSGVYGWSTGWLFQKDAVQAALHECRKHGGTQCKVAIPAFNSCGALSAGSKEAYWGIGLSKDLAESRAMDSCGKDGSLGCKVLVSLCSEAGTIAPASPSPTVPHTSPTPSPSPPVPVCPYGTQRGLGGCYPY
jgi:Domain of unknown function (DUF4189)